jgi:hypothetical protein
MSDSKFKWNDSALVPEVIEVNYPTKFNEDGTVATTENVVHTELVRKDLVEFIAEALDKNFIREVEVEVDGEKTTKPERIPFKEVEAEQAGLLFKYLAKTTKGKKDAKFFEKLEIGARGMDALVEMFFELNHIQEVTATGGNWLMLPTIRQAMSEVEAQESESQKPTLQV